jgi:hypothetical protein
MLISVLIAISCGKMREKSSINMTNEAMGVEPDLYPNQTMPTSTTSPTIRCISWGSDQFLCILYSMLSSEVLASSNRL